MKMSGRSSMWMGVIVTVAMVGSLSVTSAMAASISMTNNVHQGTDLSPESGFGLTSTGALTLGDFVTDTSVTASATGVPSVTVSDTQRSAADYSGAFATATVLAGDVMGTNSAADGVTNWIEASNFSLTASATSIADGTYGTAITLSTYNFLQFFQTTGTATYHFDFEVSKAILDPPLPGETAAGTSIFEFILGTVDANGKILDFVSTTPLSFSDNFYGTGDLSFNYIVGDYGFYAAVTSAEATTSAPVPEPGTFVLLSAGMLIGIVVYKRRRVTDPCQLFAA